MSEQTVLFGLAVPPEVRLTARQRFCLDLLAERSRSSEEIGAALHWRREVHAVDRTCRWCSAEGSAMGSRLRELRLVRFSRKLGVWYLVEQGVPKVTREPQNDDIPF